mmetsp:Transcript_6680/g.9694  ORF Transcript_6680/g.9694 Transcript_6680/m.9694 type:complete len:372 (+) Transcript_6680:104-1219(+)
MGKEQIKRRINKTKKKRFQKKIAIQKAKNTHGKESIKTSWKNGIISTSNIKENIENIKLYYRNLAGHVHFSDFMNAEPLDTFKEVGYPKENIIGKSILRENWPLLSILDEDELKKELKRAKNRSTIWVRDPQHRSKIKEERTKQKKEKKKRLLLAKEAKAREGHTNSNNGVEEKQQQQHQKNNHSKEEPKKKQKQEENNKHQQEHEDKILKKKIAGKKRKRPAAIAAALEEVSFDSVISRESTERNIHTAKRKKISNVRLLKQMEDANVTEEERQALTMASAMRTAVSGRDKRSASVLRNKIKKHAQRKKSAAKKWNDRQQQLEQQKMNTIARKQANLANKKTRGRREGFEGKKTILNSMSKIKKVLRKKK